MFDPIITPLVTTDYFDKRYTLLLVEGLDVAPQFKLKIFLSDSDEPKLIRAISIRTRQAVVLAEEILQADEDLKCESRSDRAARLLALQS